MATAARAAIEKRIVIDVNGIIPRMFVEEYGHAKCGK
jgi:hypothetical protein